MANPISDLEIGIVREMSETLLLFTWPAYASEIRLISSCVSHLLSCLLSDTHIPFILHRWSQSLCLSLSLSRYLSPSLSGVLLSCFNPEPSKWRLLFCPRALSAVGLGGVNLAELQMVLNSFLLIRKDQNVCPARAQRHNDTSVLELGQYWWYVYVTFTTLWCLRVRTNKISNLWEVEEGKSLRELKRIWLLLLDSPSGLGSPDRRCQRHEWDACVTCVTHQKNTLVTQ